MSKKPISNRSFNLNVQGISAGDHIELKAGTYKEPLIIDGKMGTVTRPIFIEPDPGATPGSVVFSSELSTKAARLFANQVANRRQRAGYYPSFGHLGDQAMLVLRNCQHVVVHGLDFRNCWPGAIYLDNCQNIVIHNVRFHGGTIAIGANGIFTHDIIVQHCHWQQDPSGSKMWNRVPWGRIHGASDNSKNPGVDLKGDYRHWDGDFFRGWDVGGNIIIRNNTIRDAFNGIHFFNSIDNLAPGIDANTLTFNNGRRSTANVLIENNDFIRVRDNVFEPEDHAWNWVIRHNRLRDCYRPFSFEFERAGFLYIYGNTGSFDTPPSSDMSDEDKERFPQSEWRANESLFKPKGRQANEGSIYVAFNSWYFKKGKGVLPKFGLGKLVHVNNATQYKDPKRGRFFGQNGDKQNTGPSDIASELIAEQSRFTRRWDDYGIEMNGDVANDIHFPDNYRALGYRIGLAAKNASPNFSDPIGTTTTPPDFTSSETAILKASIEFNIDFPDGSVQTVPKELNVGATQSKGVYSTIDRLFEFLPVDDWLPVLPAPRIS